ncbi:class I SAM-dependent methyltransferase [Candidatus Thioglobus sp.]|nr:class I SAM-dependent methyltransferase [Candidatus Thioglobus sp.]
MDHKLREKFFAELDKEKMELLDPMTKMLDKKFSKEINCPLCEAKKDKHVRLFLKDGYTFVRCETCEMIFTNPQVDSELLGELYGESKSEDIWVELQESAEEQIWKKEYYQDNLDLISKFADSNQTRLMDIGCNNGYFLDILRLYMPSILGTGLELSKKAFGYAQSKGLEVHNCFLNELNQELSYDIFTLNGVLEHIPNPSQLLTDIKNKANENAIIFAIVPNSYSLYHMFLQSKSVSFDGRDHLLYFSEKTLKKLFEKNGFEVLNIDTVLTGLTDIKKHIQWMDPYKNEVTDRYLNQQLLSDYLNEEYILENNLGLRLRIIAKLKN